MEIEIQIVFLVFWSLMCYIHAFTEMPKFNQLKLLYPGFYHHGGNQHDRDVIQHVFGTKDLSVLHHPHNTAALRMSWTLNRYSGRHSVGTKPIFLSGEGRDSIKGKDGLEYIFKNAAFGPYLAEKYGNPVVSKTEHHKDISVILSSFTGKQGIIRILSYHKDHAGGHIGLWDCDHFYQSRDWTTEHHIISVEFWESPDSYCSPKSQPLEESPQLVPLKPGSTLKIIARHNFMPSESAQSNSQYIHSRHRTEERRRRGQVKERLWLQEES